MAKGRMKKIGSAWTHKGKDEKTFLSGQLNTTELPKTESLPIFIFFNKWRKEGTQQPHYQIFISGDEMDEEIEIDEGAEEEVPF